MAGLGQRPRRSWEEGTFPCIAAGPLLTPGLCGLTRKEYSTDWREEQQIQALKLLAQVPRLGNPRINKPALPGAGTHPDTREEILLITPQNREQGVWERPGAG